MRSIDAFNHFFRYGDLEVENLDKRDGGCTRREIILRFLLLNAVLDQGPDIEGVREMMVGIINDLYSKEIRIFHKPVDFFEEINISVDDIIRHHDIIKGIRSKDWAARNQSTPGRYNLYMDNCKQTLNYAIFRWGVPIAVPYLLSKDCDIDEDATCLTDYLSSFPSSEKMSENLKSHHRYGLGKAIGDKACHLFAKWVVSRFRLIDKNHDAGWGEYSYEVPFDSNAGRVLWRSGYFLELAEESEYEKKEVIKEGGGKGDTDYIRVTNIRNMPVSKSVPRSIVDLYNDICINHLKTARRRSERIQIQRFQHPLLMEGNNKVSEFDDGLIAIGRNYCLNHGNPDCKNCPINDICRGYNSDPSLINDYRT
ncbi:hypothetical protein [Thioalkalivibrio sp. HK1]|uniref:hypothetical protein n=1 Tax=Thioalkalivibrio sp. HK1 TaxID=1469245 RepID=UPI00046F772B|nr:hypothetical protein [Thioalkalivibrio sp. HK1]